MKLLYVLLAAVLAAVVYGGVQMQQANATHDREEAEKTLQECWANAIGNQSGAELCKTLAETIHK